MGYIIVNIGVLVGGIFVLYYVVGSNEWDSEVVGFDSVVDDDNIIFLIVSFIFFLLLELLKVIKFYNGIDIMLFILYRYM